MLWFQNFLGSKRLLGSKKHVGSKKCLHPKTNWIQKFVGSVNLLGPAKSLDPSPPKKKSRTFWDPISSSKRPVESGRIRASSTLGLNTKSCRRRRRQRWCQISRELGESTPPVAIAFFQHQHYHCF